jgi:hypothetical protein
VTPLPGVPSAPLRPHWSWSGNSLSRNSLAWARAASISCYISPLWVRVPRCCDYHGRADGNHECKPTRNAFR